MNKPVLLKKSFRNRNGKVNAASNGVTYYEDCANCKQTKNEPINKKTNIREKLNCVVWIFFMIQINVTVPLMHYFGFRFIEHHNYLLLSPYPTRNNNTILILYSTNNRWPYFVIFWFKVAATSSPMSLSRYCVMKMTWNFTEYFFYSYQD